MKNCKRPTRKWSPVTKNCKAPTRNCIASTKNSTRSTRNTNRKIEELTEITEDMENLFRSASVATLFLDDESRIRRMTPKAAEIFELTHDDIGRRLDNFRNPLDEDQLYELIEESFQSQEPLEREVRGKLANVSCCD